MKRFIISALGISCLFVLIHGCAKKTIPGDAANLTMGSYVRLDSTINGIMDISNSSSAVSIKVVVTVTESKIIVIIMESKAPWRA